MLPLARHVLFLGGLDQSKTTHYSHITISLYYMIITELELIGET